MIQIKLFFFEKMFKLYMILAYNFFLNHTFLKYVMVSHYIYNLEFN